MRKYCHIFQALKRFQLLFRLTNILLILKVFLNKGYAIDSLFRFMHLPLIKTFTYELSYFNTLRHRRHVTVRHKYGKQFLKELNKQVQRWLLKSHPFQVLCFPWHYRPDACFQLHTQCIYKVIESEQYRQGLQLTHHYFHFFT